MQPGKDCYLLVQKHNVTRLHLDVKRQTPASIITVINKAKAQAQAKADQAQLVACTHAHNSPTHLQVGQCVELADVQREGRVSVAVHAHAQV
jgi:hypothetical protein